MLKIFFLVVEIQSSYNAPKLFSKASRASRASSLRSRTPLNRDKEIEISSCSASSTRAKELEDGNDFDGPIEFHHVRESKRVFYKGKMNNFE